MISRVRQAESAKTLKAALGAIRALAKILPDIEKAASLILNKKGQLITTGVGKSAFIAMKVAATLTSLGRNAIFIHSVDALHGDLGAVHNGDTVLAFSYSGESEEVVKVVQYLKKAFGASIIAVTGNNISRLGKLAKVVIPILIKE